MYTAQQQLFIINRYARNALHYARSAERPLSNGPHDHIAVSVEAYAKNIVNTLINTLQ